MEFRRQRESFWRSQIKTCPSGEEAVRLLTEDAGLDKGRAILFLRKHSPDRFNAFCKARQRQYSGL
jgi:hypothetical protein